MDVDSSSTLIKTSKREATKHPKIQMIREIVKTEQNVVSQEMESNAMGPPGIEPFYAKRLSY